MPYDRDRSVGPPQVITILRASPHVRACHDSRRRGDVPSPRGDERASAGSTPAGSTPVGGGELLHTGVEVDGGDEAELPAGPLGRRDDVADVAGAELPVTTGARAAEGVGQRGGHLADGVRLAGGDVVRRAARTASVGRRAPRTLARATSATWTKSRRWPPSSNTRAARPRSRLDRKMAATPAYGVSRGMPGPYTLW